MSALEAFDAAADRLSVVTTVVPASEATAAIDDAIQSPAIGVTPPIEGVSLPATVETDLTTAAIEAATTGITPATGAVGDYGSLTIQTDGEGTEPVSLFVDRHVAVLPASAVETSMSACVDRVGARAADGASTIVATGPSATADMGSLVEGAHGPREVHAIIVEDR